MAVFALFHSASEFTSLDSIHHPDHHAPPFLPHFFAISSFVFLYIFSIKVASLSFAAVQNRFAFLLAPVLYGWMVLALGITGMILVYHQDETGWVAGNSFSRWALGLPASLLTPFSLQHYYRLYARSLSDYRARLPMQIAGISLLGYGFVSLPVADETLLPLHFMTVSEFRQFTGFPIEIPRMIFAITLTVGFVSFIRIINRVRLNKFNQFVKETQSIKSTLESIIHQSYDAIMIHDHMGNIQMINTRMEKLFFHPEDLNAYHVNQIAMSSHPPEVAPELKAMWHRVYRGATEFLEWKFHLQKEKIQIPVEIYSCPIYFHLPEPRILTSIRDLRERYQDQDFIRSLLDFQKGILLVFRNGKLVQGNLRFYSEFRINSVMEWTRKFPEMESILFQLSRGVTPAELENGKSKLVVNNNPGVSVQLPSKGGGSLTYMIDIQTIPLPNENNTFVCTLTDITSLTNESNALREEGARDPLTGIANRRTFDRELATSVSRARAISESLTLFFIDVDHFKRVNDLGGHQEGDRILMELVRLIEQKIRPEDVFARYGGEEFAIIARGLSVLASHQLAERIRLHIENHLHFRDSPVTCSIGAGIFDPTTMDETLLVRMADRAMYEAKKNGRNRIHCHGDPGFQNT